MRTLARGVAQTYVDQRQRLEYPWLEDEGDVSQAIKKDGITAVGISTPPVSITPRPLLVEIGTEELPSGDLEGALAQIKKNVPAFLSDLRLEHGEIAILGTPRRLVIHIQDLVSAQPDLEDVVKGPPASRAFDSSGEPTKAAEGFARSKNVAVSDLEVRDFDGGEYVVAVVRKVGRPTHEILEESLPDFIEGIRFGKSMRWNRSNVAFSRPIRWFLALHGEIIIPFEFAGLRAGNVTRGLRFIEPIEIRVNSPEEYFSSLSAQGIIIDPEIRKAIVEGQINQVAAEVGGEIVPDPALLTEVANLVEVPSALLGNFNPRHLELPQEVLIGVMKKHQRYFPVHKSGKLLPHFVTVANKPSGMSLDAIKLGNEDVVRARFADAGYFVREDSKTPFVDFVPRLERLVFQADLGTMLDKTHRIGHLVGKLSQMVGLSSEDTYTAARAAKLCKADLATQMVVEMTSLQGVIGRDYALACGEPQEVSTAIFEHYLPRFANDITPQTKPGLIVGLADRFDSLVGLFSAGVAPTGSKDPFGQRRAALGLVGNLISWELDFDIRPAVESAAENLPIEASPESKTECLTFIIERLRNVLLDKGYSYDIVDAVVEAQGYNPFETIRAAGEMTSWVAREDWNTILPAYSRCVRITRSVEGVWTPVIYPELLNHESERDLFDALQIAEGATRLPGSVNDFLNTFLPLIPAIDQFFEDVLVMVDDEAVRMNRLGLLHNISALADGVLDMSKLEGF